MTHNKDRCKQTFFYVIANIFIFIILFATKGNLQLITYLSLLQLIFSLIFIIKNDHTVFSIAITFLLLSYLFHFGQSIITTFGFEDVHAHRNVIFRTSLDLYNRASYFVILAHFFLTIGIVYSPFKVFKRDKKRINFDYYLKNEFIILKNIRVIAYLVLAISLLPLVYIDIQKLIAISSSGYLSTYEVYTTGINKYIALLAQFARPAITMLLIGYKYNKRKFNIFFIITSLYFILMMFAGERGTNMIYLIANTFVYYRVVNQIKLRTVIFGLLFGYFVLVIINSISILRSSSDYSIYTLISSIQIRSDDGIIYSTLREFGGTIQSLIYSIQFIPEYTNYNFGTTYLNGFLVILPKLPSQLLSYLSVDFTFVKAFPEAFQKYLGGSYLGELYFNFGWFGTSMAIFVGHLVGFVNKTIEHSIKTRNWMVFSVCMIFFPNLLLWVRGYFVELIFTAFWMGMFILLINKIAKN
jgi:hypothetical protein